MWEDSVGNRPDNATLRLHPIQMDGDARRRSIQSAMPVDDQRVVRTDVANPQRSLSREQIVHQ